MRIQSLEAGDFSRINVNSIYCRSIIERLCNAYGTTPDATEAIKGTFDQGLSHYQIETGVEASYETMRDSLDDSEPGQRRRPGRPPVAGRHLPESRRRGDFR